jgi:hypothetical protein
MLDLVISSRSKKPLAKLLEAEFGNLLPKANLGSLPDFNSTEFIRILNQF